MASDAFIVGEDWISEHYFGAEQTKQSFQKRLLDARKTWDARTADGETTPKARLASIKGALLAALAAHTADRGDDTSRGTGDTGLAAMTEAARASYEETVLTPLVEALGYPSRSDASAAYGFACEIQGPVTWFTPAHAADAPALALVKARPVSDVGDLLAKNEHTLLAPFTPEDEQADTLRSVARTLSWVFAGENAPPFALVLSGGYALVAEKTRWAEGRYLAVDVQLVLDRADAQAVKKKGGDVDRMVAVLGAESLLPAVDGTVWWEDTLAESVKHTVGVSQDLRDGVRESIEIIANEVVARRQAAGLGPLPQAEANTLARQSLRYLYRILFLLYAEASPELGVLPVGAPEYAQGYGLDRLRELVLVELGEQSRGRTHLYASLARLFKLVDAGSTASSSAEGRTSGVAGTAEHVTGAEVTTDGLPDGLNFQSLNADLFLPAKTSLIDEVRLGDLALQRVLQLLLLTRESQSKKGRDRGFISYADLGINQLGSVYEGLMSYSGFFAEEDLFEVAKDGDASKGSWVVPVSRSEHLPAQHFVLVEDPHTGQKRPRRYRGGEFVYRLSGRARQQSASYYSPEVLTRFVVTQALEELLDQGETRTSAREILSLSVCEPALGSGAFAIEAVRQLAEEYLKRREAEVGERIDPDERPRELQKAKAQIALHQVYGVDLNDTAVELAEISLWLDTMVEGLDAPWFGLRLRRGNSLIGARRAVYSKKQIEDRAWLKDAPASVPVAGLAREMRDGTVGGETSGRVHHFLLPAQGWGAACEAKEAKTLAPEAHKKLNDWRKQLRIKPSKQQIARLAALTHRAEALWQFTLRRLEIAEHQVQRDITLWNDPRETIEAGTEHTAATGTEAAPGSVTRAKVEEFLRDQDAAYQRLRRVMDAWSAMWFWPLTDTLTGGVTPPSLDKWIAGLEALMGLHRELKPQQVKHGAATLALPNNWDDLAVEEGLDLGYASALPVNDVLQTHPWLRVAERIAAEQGFFHWELDFAGIFARGGFDLQVGNPPWVRPRSDVDALLAEGDPWWQLASKPTQAEVKEMRAQTLLLEGISDLVLDGTAEVACTAEFVGSPLNYPHLAGLQPDLYRCFMEQTWRHANARGMTSLIHPESHFTDEKAGALRAATYGRLRRHWQFVNELVLFEIDHHVSYGVHVYGAAQTSHFAMATNLYHPETVASSLRHDGSGPEPGLKTPEGKWDLRPHAGRITHVTPDVLATWHQLLESESIPVAHTRMVYSVNSATASVLAKLARAPRLGELELEFSAGWHEKNDRTKGVFDVEWGEVESWREAILQGPHLFVATPFYKSPNSTMKHNQDWTPVDLEALAPDVLPVTAYKRAQPTAEYDAGYTHWGDNHVPARDHFRIAWRAMAANSGERTLIPAIIPPGATHVHGVSSLALPGDSLSTLLHVQTTLSSLVCDLSIRSAPKSTIGPSNVRRLPRFASGVLDLDLLIRTIRLNAVSSAYAELCAFFEGRRYQRVEWTGGIDYPGRPLLGDVGAEWTPAVPLRRDADRRQALLEIDAIVALSLGVTADELCTIYRTQFAVLYGYDRNSYFYDANGRLVPGDVLKVYKAKGDAITLDERTATHPGSGVSYTYELPFVTLDREADMRRAYAHFEQVLEQNS